MLAFFLSPLGRSTVITAVFIALMGSCSVQSARLKSAKADLATAKALLYVPDLKGKPTRVTWQQKAELAETNLSTCRTNGETLSGALERQSASLTALKAEGDRRARDNAKALEAGRKQGAAALSEAERILGLHTKGADTCQRLLDAERQISENDR